MRWSFKEWLAYIFVSGRLLFPSSILEMERRNGWQWMWLRLVEILDSTSLWASLTLDERRPLWANGAKVWIFQGPFAVGTFSFHAPDLCDSRWPADGSHRHSLQDINAVDRPCKTMAKIPKIITLGYGKGDSRLVPPIKNVNSLLRAAPSIFWKDPAGVYSSMSSNMFGTWWAFATASNLLLANKPTLHE